MNENEATMPVMDAPPTAMNPGRIAGIGEQAQLKQSHETSYIDHQPDNQVVLSHRLEQLVRRVGGCQTHEVLAVVRRIMYEVLVATRKY